MKVSIKLPRLLRDTVRGLNTEASGTTVAGALEDLFRGEPGLRHHLLDEQGSLRRHVAVFVDGERGGLDTPLNDGSVITVLQAVSGGQPL